VIYFDVLKFEMKLSVTLIDCSTTTTLEVIRVLLSKFHITDNPRKFALYEKTQQIDKTGNIVRIV
jgi:Ras association (RalGDS/AF-6) domain